jgi:hypothetical protein
MTQAKVNGLLSIAAMLAGLDITPNRNDVTVL